MERFWQNTHLFMGASQNENVSAIASGENS